jgi:ribonucleotide reductase beta subunit family protein with ferritin-like domain
MSNKTRIQTETQSYARYYPKIVELANKQLEEQMWFASEMKVELERIQLKYELEAEQLQTVNFILNLFVKYEMDVADMWAKISRLFPRPEVKLACSVAEMVERAVHAEFYNKINIQLGLDQDEHYFAFLNNPYTAQRAEWIGKLLNSEEDELLSVIIFSMTETALLFSSFAMLKSFQSNGYNKIPIVVRGTNQSALDEDLHGIISAEIVNTHFAELGVPLFEDKKRYREIVKAVHSAYELEESIIDTAIPGDSLNGVKKQEFKEFVKHRLNIYLERLGLPHEFHVGECSIVDWFGKNTYSYKKIDFFTSGQGSEYQLAWDEHALGHGFKDFMNKDE